MYKIIKTVIESKRFELSDMLKKIDTFWVQDNITEEEHAELIKLARKKALPENSYAGTQARIDTLYKEVADIKKRLSLLENGENTESPVADEFPEFVQPTGAHDAYHSGSKITYNGIRYVYIAPDGIIVVWSPDTMPDYWQEYVETEELV